MTRAAMARLRTLDRDMTDGDLLAFSCRACSASFKATRRQAIRRFGAHADPMLISHRARCHKCGSDDVAVTLLSGDAWDGYGAGGGSRLTHPERQALTMRQCLKRGWRCYGSCDRCDNRHQLGRLEAMIEAGTGDKPFLRLIANRRLACRICGGEGRIERVLVLDTAGEPMAEYMGIQPDGQKLKQTSRAAIRALAEPRAAGLPLEPARRPEPTAASSADPAGSRTPG